MRFAVDPTTTPTVRKPRNVSTSLLGAAIEFAPLSITMPSALAHVVSTATSELTICSVYVRGDHVHFQATDDDGNLFDLFACWGEWGHFTVKEINRINR